MEIKLLEIANTIFGWNYDNLNIDIEYIDKTGIKAEACTPANIFELFISAENLNIVSIRERHAGEQVFYSVSFNELNTCPEQYRAMAVLWVATGNNIDNQ